MRHVSTFLFVIAMLYSITGYSQTFDGNWHFEKAEMSISPIDSPSFSFTPSKTVLSINDLSLSNDWELVPIELKFEGTTVFLKTSSIEKTFNHELTSNTIILFDIEEDNEFTQYDFELNGNILYLKYTFFKNDNKGKTTRYTIKCTYNKK